MIRIQNIYYMLSYAFQVLSEQGYKRIGTESFDHAGELLAAILMRGVSQQVKRGLGREYNPRTEAMSSPRGKIEVAESVKTRSILRKQLVCAYDDFTVNYNMNRIIKSTILQLLSSDLSKTRKKELRRLLVYFDAVEPVDLHTVDWHIQYNRNNQTYRMLVSICFLIVKGLLQTNTAGTAKQMDFLDEQRMCRLYERFILEYYRKEFPKITANASQIRWQVDDGMDRHLPVMQTDIMLTCREKTLIIDAKYYDSTMHSRYAKKTLHSENLYQMFAYVKNKEAELTGRPHEVSGLLLYAQTDEEILPNQEYRMSGNIIGVSTLDLNREFSEIAAQLNGIVERYFGSMAE